MSPNTSIIQTDGWNKHQGKSQNITDNKQLVFLPGASGSMGFEVFKRLWEKRDQYDIVLIQLPTKYNKKLFRPYEKEAGIQPIHGAGVVRGEGLKIVWGDATIRDNVNEACKGINWCLNCMALISPEADRNPEEAYRVNSMAIQYIVEAIEARDPENIKMVSVGTIAEYGDRLPPVHVGRVGDPVFPSKFDIYAHSKIKGELTVMESGIKHWVSLRQTFIMLPDLFSLMDPIMFHQPINSFMENITARDSGRLMVSCLDIPDESDFWRRCYNISGGPQCRTTFLEFLDRIYSMLGVDYRKAMDRRWFALRNFHMQFFEDADILNGYLNHWDGGQTMEDFFDDVWTHLPRSLKMIARINKIFPPLKWIVQKSTFMQLKKLAGSHDGTLGWIRENNTERIEAFYGSREKFKEIPAWDVDVPSLDHNMTFTHLDHGYDEDKSILDIDDLRKAASFRGGELMSDKWDGDSFSKLSWRCCKDHSFEMSPNAILKAGHWCVECVGPPWDYDHIASKSGFFSQVYKVGETQISGVK